MKTDTTTAVASRGKIPTAAADAFLQLLARAVHNFRIYPADSTFRIDAIAGCQAAHAALSSCDHLVCHVTPRALVVDEVAIGAGTVIEHELARRLHRAHVAELTIECSAESRDFSRFCTDLLGCDLRQGDGGNLAERLIDHGVDAIVPTITSRPEVLSVDRSWEPQNNPQIAPHQPESSEAADGSTGYSIGYLYPKGKGWVRVNSDAPEKPLSVMDLAVLVDDPADLAVTLFRLSSEGETEEINRATALRLKFDDIAMIYASTGPELSRPLFAKLAEAVLDLGADARKALLKATVLPGLLDGRSGAQILNEFPDVDLADAIGLLLDLETAEPGVINAALSSLDISPERQQALGPLLQTRLKQSGEAKTPGRPESAEALDRFAQNWIKVDTTVSKNFQEFSAFDLSFDAQARAGTVHVSAAIERTDAHESELVCLLGLIRLNPNPQVAERLLKRLVAIFATFERGERWDAFVLAVAHARDLAATLQTSRPDIGDAISRTLSKCCTRVRALRIVQLYSSGDEARAIAGRLVDAFGTIIVPIFVSLIEEGLEPSAMAALSQLMRDHARALAPGMTSALGRCSPQTACVLIEFLSFAGPGVERALSNRLQDDDDAVAQAALEALVRIGTGQAAAALATQIRTGIGSRSALVEEALRRFPVEVVKPHVFDLLRDRDFVGGHPDVAFRLLERARTDHLGVPRETLLDISRLYFRVWHPALARVGFKARRMAGI